MSVLDPHDHQTWLELIAKANLGLLHEHEIKFIQTHLDRNAHRIIGVFRSNTVGLRTLAALNRLGVDAGDEFQTWAGQEAARVSCGMEAIAAIHQFAARRGIRYAVIKALDNYPDQGVDVDLYVEDHFETVDRFLRDELSAVIQRPTLCDRIAQKTNYLLPSRIDIEVHYRRLGQVGENLSFGREILRTLRPARVAGVDTYEPAPELQFLLMVWQRIYRHFDFRIADLVNSVRWLAAFDPHLATLKAVAEPLGMQPGALIAACIVRNKLEAWQADSMPASLTALPRGGVFDLQLRSDGSRYAFPVRGVLARVYCKAILYYLARLNLKSILRIMLLFPLYGAKRMLNFFFPRSLIGDRLW